MSYGLVVRKAVGAYGRGVPAIETTTSKSVLWEYVPVPIGRVMVKLAVVGVYPVRIVFTTPLFFRSTICTRRFVHGPALVRLTLTVTGACKAFPELGANPGATDALDTVHGPRIVIVALESARNPPSEKSSRKMVPSCAMTVPAGNVNGYELPERAPGVATTVRTNDTARSATGGSQFAGFST